MDTEKSETKKESVYKIITLIGTSTESWEKAAKYQGIKESGILAHSVST